MHYAGCHIDGVAVNNLSYADDMVLLGPSIDAMRRLTKICESYAVAHGLRYNVKKSEVMMFKAGRKTYSTAPLVTLYDVPLNFVTKFKYLGHWVTDDLSDDVDIERERRSLAVRCNMLARRFGRCTAPVKLTLFKAYCQSFYTCSLWTNFTQRAYNGLRVQYNNAFRVLMGLPRFCSASGMFADAQTDSFATIMRKRCASLMCRLRGSPNTILSVWMERENGPMLARWQRLHAVIACHGALRTTTTTTTTPASPPPTLPQLQATVDTRPLASCPDDAIVNTPLQRLRSAMRDTTYTQMSSYFDAFLVFYSDEHLSEEPSADERRLQYISGWDGAGTAAVLAQGEAAVWVSSGDLTRARSSLSCSWLVIDADDPGQPSIAEWIAVRLSHTGRVGADARLVSLTEWSNLATGLQRDGVTLINMPALIDQLWNEEVDSERRRPEPSRIVASLHQSDCTGFTWREKVNFVRNELRQNGADSMVVTALDEVAWLLNVRGRDLPYAPLLKAFVIISTRDLKVYVPQGKLSMPVREELSVYNCQAHNNNCTRKYYWDTYWTVNDCVKTHCPTNIKDYSMLYTDLRRSSDSKILIPTGGTFQRGASAAILQSVAQAKRLYALSPIIYLKAQKTPAEVKCMRKAHLRDAVAMCTLLSYMEGMVKTGQSEISIATKVDVTRATQANYIGPSMRTRIAFGPNAADPDYRATVRSNRRVFGNSTLVIQSGGQYIEGTTLVTRTIHYGKASVAEKRAYTTVLRSLAALATLRAPAALPAAHLDPAARAPLWAARQDYPRPTGHGVGAALHRREDPVVIDYRQDKNLYTLAEGYFITSEPAWYESGKFGVALGNVLEVGAKPSDYLFFTEATLVPYDEKLIEKSMLTEYEITWLNTYNKRIRDVVGPELKAQGLTDVFYWMMNRTVPYELPSKRARYQSNSASINRCVVLGVLGAISMVL